jgi:hypothetical protein
MLGSSKPDINEFRLDNESFDALTNDMLAANVNKMKLIAHIFLLGIAASKNSISHIDDCIHFLVKINGFDECSVVCRFFCKLAGPVIPQLNPHGS